MTILATFMGTDGSLGYENGRQYELKLIPEVNDPKGNITICLPNGLQECEYNDIIAFFDNWDNIITQNPRQSENLDDAEFTNEIVIQGIVTLPVNIKVHNLDEKGGEITIQIKDENLTKKIGDWMSSIAKNQDADMSKRIDFITSIGRVGKLNKCLISRMGDDADDIDYVIIVYRALEFGDENSKDYVKQ